MSTPKPALNIDRLLKVVNRVDTLAVSNAELNRLLLAEPPPPKPAEEMTEGELIEVALAPASDEAEGLSEAEFDAILAEMRRAEEGMP